MSTIQDVLNGIAAGLQEHKAEIEAIVATAPALAPGGATAHVTERGVEVGDQVVWSKADMVQKLTADMVQKLTAPTQPPSG